MKLSTRSRYGTRLMADLAHHYNEGPVKLCKIAKRQDISVKYLEQLIAPLREANLIKSVRGPKGGHMLSKSPDEIKIGEIVTVLENGINLTQCVENPNGCDRAKNCKTRNLWGMATKAMYDKLNDVTLSEIME